MAKINKQGIDAMFADIARKIEKADAEIRRDHAGKPADDVEPVAARKFKAIGVNLTPAQIKDYAKSVESRSDFRFNLR